jgi:hypothetical protein
MKFAIKASCSEIIKKLLVTGALCLLFLPFDCFAETPAEYREGIRSASASTRELIDYLAGIADDERQPDPGFERDALAAIRRNLPATEKVEWEGTLIETGNQWLEAKLKAFEEETADRAKRLLILTEVGERLSALEEKIDQLENAQSSNRSKDEDKQKLAEILRRAEYQKPEAQQESWFQRMQKKISDWFNQKFPQPDVPEGAEKGLRSFSVALQILVYVLVLGFIAFLIYRFAPFFADRFRRREKEDQGERVILGEKLSANENAQTLFDEAEAMARSGNLRGAIRKGYVALLCELSDRKIIGLAQHKTNRDYLRDVRKKGELYQNMNGLTTSFERHWYGFETADEAAWNEFKRNYQKAVGGEN